MAHALRIGLIFSLATLFSGLVCSQERYWQQDLQYKINVRLNDTVHTLDGFLDLQYINNSPDTLGFIWFHLWPNAYKNDKTAFSDQLLENGRTDFYFSGKEKRGYINRMDFRINDIAAKTEDHPNFIDIIKVILPNPLAPKESIRITTPFHVQLPFTFSRGGHDAQTYQVTQWYPKPAVYDRNGWHPMPYLDQGEFYSEFGSYEVKITLPKNYIVAATGELQTEEEKIWLSELSRQLPVASRQSATKNQKLKTKNQKPKPPVVPSSPELKTVIYKQDRVHDFAWFGDKRFVVNFDTLRLGSGRLIDVYSFYTPEQAQLWRNSIGIIKDAVTYHSLQIGEYPYNTISAVQGKQGFEGGMEYPTITILSALKDTAGIKEIIFHEVGHNWFYGILANNERDYAWLDEGINYYYDSRFKKENLKSSAHRKKSKNRLPDDWEKLMLETVISVHADQPIQTHSDQFHKINYQLMNYVKASEWMKKMEETLGKDLLDSCMQEYYRRWQFKHPYPEDLKEVLTDVSGKNLDSFFHLLHTRGSLDTPQKKKLRIEPFFNLNNSDKYNYVFVSPALGFNLYDGLMVGGALHNYTLPLNKFRYFVAPFYGTRSKAFTGIGRISHTWYPERRFQDIEIALSGSSFTKNDFTDSTGNKMFFGYRKLAPSIRLEWKQKSPRSTTMKFIQLKSFFIGEDELNFRRDTVLNTDIIEKIKTNYTIGQLKFVWDNFRMLYPYRVEMILESGKDFGKIGLTGNYFFNFVKKGGVNLRLFAGKFFYYGEKTFTKQFDTDRFHLNMTGPKGDEDYTYSNYFFGRNKFEGTASQQIMIRDGAFKVRTDLLSSKIGKTDNWLGAANFTMDVPDRFNILNALPVKIPLKIFADFGTYAEVWDEDSEEPRFVFDAGLQFSFYRNLINIYMPLVYSQAYSDYFKSTPNNNFWQRISFSIDIQNISVRKLVNQAIQ
jgi:Peptidase family M1 domain